MQRCRQMSCLYQGVAQPGFGECFAPLSCQLPLRTQCCKKAVPVLYAEKCGFPLGYTNVTGHGSVTGSCDATLQAAVWGLVSRSLRSTCVCTEFTSCAPSISLCPRSCHQLWLRPWVSGCLLAAGMRCLRMPTLVPQDQL